MEATPTVLISGAGPVGLVAALSLRQAGVNVQVVDAGRGIDRRMRASTIHPPTLDMLATLGLADGLIEQGRVVSRWQFRQHESSEYVEFDLGMLRDLTAFPYRLQVEQHRLCSLAIAALAALGVVVRFGSAVTDLEQDGDGVTAILEEETIRANWLIGADGANSTVRKSAGLAYAGKTYTHSSVLLSTPFAFHEHLDDLTDVCYCWSQRGPFSLLRLKDIWRVSLYPGVEALADAAAESRVREWLGYIHPDAHDADILDLSPYRVHERCVDRFRVNRVLLAGDAAHLNPPSGGMGMNGGIHDAINLAGKLVAVIGGGDRDLLDLYSRQRHEVVSGRIIPQAAANRARMAVTTLDAQMRRLDRYRSIASDAERCREFLLGSSMIESLRIADNVS